ncbi:membrane-bound lytic murein transglycosylase B [Marinospirillum celere]|uniref:Membrane-bound lytic murein transglycosylase B n=1 Tax=Marinospirillum celere TaxID=1122252 RepID=A0A1I1FVZ2_9GAMM|nr:lytic murein transglycosylase B [Marinospirillum celere]SFC03192.1 membrane-bound lytic murein transglycosylase B [Marinospirillum celere]
MLLINKKFAVGLLIAGLLSVSGLAAAGYYDPALRGDVQAYIDELVNDKGHDRQELSSLFAQAQKRQDIQDLMSRPAERVLPWYEYRKIFITQQRIDAGRVFMEEYEEPLARAEAEYGVAPEVIAAIIGIETFYGRNKGRHRVIDALATLSFDYPQDTPRDRSSFFQTQLTEFLNLTREQGLNPRLPMGSYAGAMGYPQFIPTSYRDFAVDFSGDGFIDIWTNPVDAIGSVANYFKEHGWQSDEPILLKARLEGDGNGLADLRRNRFERIPLSEAEAAGLKAKERQGVIDSTRVLPMAFKLEEGERFALGLPNFYVITRYNHSRMYALAVYELAEALRQ